MLDQLGDQEGGLEADMNRLLAFLFGQGLLDEQFLQLQQLQDEASPNFVFEVITIYFRESDRILNHLRALLYDNAYDDLRIMSSSSVNGSGEDQLHHHYDDDDDDDQVAVLQCYQKMGIHLNRFMGSSSSIGAQRVRNVCIAFRDAVERCNMRRCLHSLEVLEHEYCNLKNKLHELFQLIEEQRQQSVLMTSGPGHPQMMW